MVLFLGFSGNVAARDGSPEQLYCPVSGSPVDRETHIDHEGRRVYLCCSLCADAFKAEPAKYIKRLDEQMNLREKKSQTACPVTGNPINREYVLEAQGHYVYFCCNLCRDEFKKDPQSFMQKMEAQGVALEKAPDHTWEYLGAAEGAPKPQQP